MSIVRHAALLCLVLLSGVWAEQKPNVVIIFLDDSGWGDFKPFGNPPYETPHVEQLAREGVRFNQFYVPSAVCSASRSALMSGCYPGRTKVFGAHGPNGRGLSPTYATMAEVLKSAGYHTAHYGKWHCGDTPETRPLSRGFDEHAGLMYSNDMWRFHPGNPTHWGKFPLQYWDNGKVVIDDVNHDDQKYLTKKATEKAVSFIQRHKDAPFFVYLAHSMPHVPLYCSPEFEGKSGAGLYGDVITEIDWSVGQIMKTLKELELEDNTLLVFSSDNGPWVSYGNHAGVTPYREAKGTSFDGGIRSATIMRFPGKMPAGKENNRAFCTIDLLPTIAGLCGADLPENDMDGMDVWPVLCMQDDAENPHDFYAIEYASELQCVISADGKWKLHLPHQYRTLSVAGKDGQPGAYSKNRIEWTLFDLENDPYEKVDVLAEHPEFADKLKKWANDHQQRFYSGK
jgi:arylsulfatase A-like enzyme